MVGVRRVYNHPTLINVCDGCCKAGRLGVSQGSLFCHLQTVGGMRRHSVSGLFR